MQSILHKKVIKDWTDYSTRIFMILSTRSCKLWEEKVKAIEIKKKSLKKSLSIKNAIASPFENLDLVILTDV